MACTAVKENKNERFTFQHHHVLHDLAAFERDYRIEDDHDELREEIEREERILKEYE